MQRKASTPGRKDGYFVVEHKDPTGFDHAEKE